MYDASKSSYPVYTKPDPVQQYATSYNQDKDVNAEPSDQFSTYLEPVGNYQPYTGYSGIVPYANANVGGYNPGAFAVQSGYEGYLVPGPPQALAETKKEVTSRSSFSSFLDPIASTVTSLARSFPGSMMFGRSLSFFLGLLGVTVFGGGLTTAICTFTPLCTISFALPFAGLRSGFRTFTEKTVGPENADMIEKVIETFTTMETQERAQAVAKSEAPVADSDITVKAAASSSIASVPEAKASVPEPTPKVAVPVADKERSDPNTK